MPAVSRLPVVGVIGSSSDPCLERAGAVGHWLAGLGVHLVTGGGGGVMGAVSRAFAEVPNRRGSVLGIVPSAAPESPAVPKPGYPNQWVEIPIFTHLPLSGRRGEEPLSRNHLVVLTSAVIIALPGGPGTASELRLALRYGRPVIAYLKSRDEIEGLPDGAIAEPDLEKVKEFVLRELAKSMQAVSAPG
jgi:uncharacterized protein (TIGR00725 family)